MLNVIAIVSILALFVLYDIVLFAARLLAPRRAFEITESFLARGVRYIFSILRLYCSCRLSFENPSGVELPERFVLVSNHQSLLDIPVWMALIPSRSLRFVAKWELRQGIPFISLILRVQGHALIRRKGGAAQAMRALSRYARRCAEEGTCPVIFPEGTRSRDGEVGVFHTAGIRKILDETPLPMVIAVLEGGWRVAKLLDVARNLTGARFRVRVLAVTPVIHAKQEVMEAVAAARSMIADELGDIRREDLASE